MNLYKNTVAVIFNTGIYRTLKQIVSEVGEVHYYCLKYQLLLLLIKFFRVFTITYMKKPMFLVFTLLQLYNNMF
jgi:hypothetical protein